MVFCFIVCFQARESRAQCAPIVPNGGFEEYTALPTDDCDWALAQGWNNAANSSNCNSSNGTPDYYHLQGTGPFSALPINYYSELNPFEGSAVMGLGGNLSFAANAREYISTTLSAPLTIGNQYTLSFSLTCGNPQVGGNYTDGWGALLTTGAVLQPAGTNGPIVASGYEYMVPGVFSSQDWQTFTITFIADQAYDHITIGNFYTDAEQTTVLYGVQEFVALAYVFLDDVQIIDLSNNPISVSLANQVVCAGDQVALTAITQGGSAPYSYSWSVDALNATDTQSIVASSNEIIQVTVTDCSGNSAQAEAQSDVLSFFTDLGPSQDLCDGPIILNAANPIATGYEWSTGETSSSIVVNSSGLYIIEIAWQCGVFADTIVVNDCPQLSVSLGPDQPICEGEILSLQATVTGGIAPYNFEWSETNSANAPSINVAPQTDIVYTLVVTDAIGNSDSDDVLLTVIPLLPSLNLGADTVLCPGEILMLNAATNGASSYTWNTGSSSETISINEPGSYYVEASSQCFITSDTLLVTSGLALIPDFESEWTLCEEEEINIGPFVDSDASFIWTDSGSIEFPRLINSAGLYTFNVSDPCGVRSFDINVRSATCNCSVYLPNSFTPNNDGINDYFAPDFNCNFSLYDFKIYNRWGQQVFASTDPEQKWIGNDPIEKQFYVPDGVYVWMLNAKSDEGLESTNSYILTGTVSVIR